MGFQQLPILEFEKPRPPYFKCLVRAAQIRKSFFQDTPEGFEDPSLLLDSIGDTCIYRKSPQVHAPGNLYVFKVSLQRPGKDLARLCDADGKPGVGACNGAEHKGDILDRSGHGALNGKRRPPHGCRPFGNPSRRIAQSDNVAEICRIPKRSAQIAPVCDGDHAAGQRHRCPAAAAAAGSAQVIRIQRFTENFVKGLGTGAEFRGICLSDGNSARLFQPFDDECILIRNIVLIDRGSISGFNAPGLNKIFVSNGKPVKRTDRIPFGQHFIGCPGPFHGLFRKIGDDGIHFRVDPLDLVQVCLHDFFCRYFFGSDLFCKISSC